MTMLLATGSVDFLQLGIGLFGGLGLFLFGMHQMASGLKAAAGTSMKQLLARLTTNRFLAVFTGALVTAVIQSSSVTTVLVVGFVSAGVMTFAQSVGVIMGANIGTTVTAQIVAFDVAQLAWLMVGCGFAVESLARRKGLQHYGMMLLGLGLLFLGMEQMSNAAEPLREYDPFIQMMKQVSNPLWGILLGAIFTAVIQSSSATTGLVIVLASQGFLTLEGGIALAIGANVGTCVTALLASVGKPVGAVRAAAVHIQFNLLGAAIWYAFIPELAELARAISPSFESLDGMRQLAAETPRQIANANTIFNVANVLLMIGFTTPLARFTMRLIPDRPQPKPARIEPKYLEPLYLESPSMALDQVQRELQHMGQILVTTLDAAPSAVIQGGRQQLQAIAKSDSDVDHLHAEVLKYLRSIARDQMQPSDTARLSDLIAVANQLESIGDITARDLVTQGLHRLEADLTMSEETQRAFRPLVSAVVDSLRNALAALESGDMQLAQNVIDRKAQVRSLARAATDHLGRRLLADEPNRVELFRLETEVVGQSQRLFYHTLQIANTVLAGNHSAR